MTSKYTRCQKALGYQRRGLGWGTIWGKDLGRGNGGETPQNPDRKVPNLKEWGLQSQGGASPYMATYEHVLGGSLALTKALQEQDVGAFGRPWPLS